MTMFRRALIFVLMFATGLTAGLVVVGRMRGDEARAQTAAAPQTPTVTAPGPVGTGGTLPDFSRIAERAVPAVVNISAQQVVSQRVIDPWAGFFGDRRPRTRRGVTSSLGSGVIISRDGYILTNNHVVAGDAGQQSLTLEQLDVKVTLSDNRELDALVIGTDPATDLALLKIDAQNLPTLPWGDSTKLKVAEWVLAIGNPYQLSQSVSLGIVSALNRTNLGVSSYEDFIQTDAAINPGNSGGALVNARGELIGINTVIFSQSGGYQGIGFAVSSNLARRIVSDLQQYKEVRRGSIGMVDLRPVTPQLARRVMSPDVRGGAVVWEIDERSAAYQAGIQPGDVIVSFNGTEVTDVSRLNRLISDARIGSTATFGVVRAGRRVDVRVPIVRPAPSTLPVRN